MSSTRKSLGENWLLVEWQTGGRDVVYVRSVVSPVNKELKIGDALTVNRRGEPEAATLIARAREREMLDVAIKQEGHAGTSEGAPHDEVGEDFSSSASSWAPSDDGVQSGDSGAEEFESKKVALERYKRQYSNKRSGKKIITPSMKANAVINIMNRKRTHKETQRNMTPLCINKSIPDSTKRKQNGAKKVTIDVRELLTINNNFRMLFKMLDDMKGPGVPRTVSPKERVPLVPNVGDSMHQSYNQLDQYIMDEDKGNDNEVSENEDFNRSDDNVLISNKYSNVGIKTVDASQNIEDKEWIPIGSGKTLIHKDKFARINWKSYTIATRTLLLAAFPRRILATHSLTGKRSPAFQNKPAKMCLDPKITTDIIMEIMDRFNVRENLVRSIITTKCADECKMWKTRNKKRKMIKTTQDIIIDIKPEQS